MMKKNLLVHEMTDHELVRRQMVRLKTGLKLTDLQDLARMLPHSFIHMQLHYIRPLCPRTAGKGLEFWINYTARF